MKKVLFIPLIVASTIVAVPFLAYVYGNIAVDFIQSMRGKRG
jgi:hypothetical protein